MSAHTLRQISLLLILTVPQLACGTGEANGESDGGARADVGLDDAGRREGGQPLVPVNTEAETDGGVSTKADGGVPADGGTDAADGSTVSVGDVENPVITSFSVTPGTLVTAGKFKLSATATDNIGVTRVEFWRAGKVVGVSATPPYTIEDPVAAGQGSNGSREYWAEAFDKAGNFVASQKVTVSVAMDPTLGPMSQYGAAVASDGSVFVRGVVSDTLFPVLRRMAPDGTVLFSKGICGSLVGFAHAFALPSNHVLYNCGNGLSVHADENGNAVNTLPATFAMGAYEGDAIIVDRSYTVRRVTPSGLVRWVSAPTSAPAGSIYHQEVSVSAGGGVVVALVSHQLAAPKSKRQLLALRYDAGTGASLGSYEIYPRAALVGGDGYGVVAVGPGGDAFIATLGMIGPGADLGGRLDWNAGQASPTASSRSPSGTLAATFDSAGALYTVGGGSVIKWVGPTSVWTRFVDKSECVTTDGQDNVYACLSPYPAGQQPGTLLLPASFTSAGTPR
jgi:hypothetical protein